ncbi:PREDICTED: glutathione peroxidase-like [Rhagoletis zephyria]|uniref:glutathione peroxidase-like n=1 Tax=Rhagoletis zephyria TaxID=28612 RepID=UPI0008113A42|nr:PREDICTED: glutathione peroxidase-like [Rhagoletis zephyria]KAH9404271.1 Glutathione peroxidase 3 [Tyrophagus putrescentiae]
MLRFLLLAGALLLASVAQCDVTESTRPSLTNASRILDSINKDLEEIKRTLAQAQENRSRPLTGEPLSIAKTPQLSGHYLTLEQENTDRPWVSCAAPTDDDSIYKYSIPYLNQSLGLLDFSQFRGKPLLLVNVATFCESTIEYPLYNQLKDKFGDKLIIVAFPSNQFDNQEPTSDAEEIFNAIKYVRPGKGFVPKFPLTKRIDVNGENRHPIYSFLKRCCPSTRTRFSAKEELLLYKPKNSRDIRWNFEKFLISPRTGYPVKRYDQKFLPDRLIPDIEALIEEAKRV